MKARIYLKVARNKRGVKVSAHPKPSYTPLTRSASGSYDRVALPTVHLAIDLEIPDEAFNPIPAGKVILDPSEFPLPVVIHSPEEQP